MPNASQASPAIPSRISYEPPRLPAAGAPLSAYLSAMAAQGEGAAALAELVGLLARGAMHVSEVASLGAINGDLSVELGSSNQGGDAQKRLDLVAHEAFVEELQSGPVAAILSEEAAHPIPLHGSAPFAIAIDPLDGSSNINANMSLGTIFGVYPARPGVTHLADHFLGPGEAQAAAGFIIYGPQTSLVLTAGRGTHVFTLDRRSGCFRLAIPKLSIPEESNEYAVNASNYRYWDDGVRAYIDDCIQGSSGPFQRDYNMRWTASLVAEAYRILIRGGLFLYPGDARRGYRHGRLRHVYEANPIAFLVEEAGGAATDTVHRLLELRPRDVHAKTPFAFGSRARVRRMSAYHADHQRSAERAPLFFQRGLIRR